MFKKPIPAPTHEQRIERANATAGHAVAIFLGAADDLDVAAQAHASVVEDIEAEIARHEAEMKRLNELASRAAWQADDATEAARKIRALLA